MKPIARLHYLTQDNIPGFSHPHQVRTACDAGVQWIQLRTKLKDEVERKKIFEDCTQICHSYNVTVIINDFAEAVAEFGADGVHLGLEDTQPERVRFLMGENKILGLSSHNPQEITRGVKAGAHYLGLGPLRFTHTKEHLAPLLGIEGIKQGLTFSGNLPVVAIGGIRVEDLGPLINAGIHGVAVSSLVNGSEQPSIMLKKLLKEIEHYTAGAPETVE